MSRLPYAPGPRVPTAAYDGHEVFSFPPSASEWPKSGSLCRPRPAAASTPAAVWCRCTASAGPGSFSGCCQFPDKEGKKTRHTKPSVYGGGEIFHQLNTVKT